MDQPEHRIFVGGLPWAAGEQDLAEAFRSFGTITSARIILDRETQRSRGFGFVTFDTAEAATEAIAHMDGKEISGRRITVRPAEARQPRPRQGSSPSNEASSHHRRGRDSAPREGGPRGRPGGARGPQGDRKSTSERSRSRAGPSRPRHDEGGDRRSPTPRSNPWDNASSSRRDGARDSRGGKRRHRQDNRDKHRDPGFRDEGPDSRREGKKRKGRGARGGGRASDYEDFGHDDW